MENISLDYYKIFYVVAKNGNFTKASKELFISQPAISQTIKKMESILGFSLFIREKKGVVLTSQGQEIFNRLSVCFSSIDSIENYVASINSFETGSLFIGIGTNIAKKVLLEPLTKFLKLYPNIHFKQIDAKQSDMLNMLLKGEIDLCVSQKNNDSTLPLEFMPIIKEEFVLVCLPDYLKNVSTDNFTYIVQQSGSYTRKLFEQNVSDKKFKTIEVAGYNLGIELCKKGLGILLCPKFLVEDEIVKKQFVVVESLKNSGDIVYGCYYNQATITKSTKEFIKLLCIN